MKLIDSNLLVYSAQTEFSHLRITFAERDIFISDISKVEVLGYHLLEASDKLYFEALFRQIKPIHISDNIILKAIELRQRRKMSLGDSIIAATGLIYNCTVFTRNETDFQKIEGLKVFNPLK